jgi:L-ascorbate metabolism protein UlaG (beta-lactamase superfamily)
MAVWLEWYGVSTFRLRVGETVVFLDAYLDRVSTAPPTGLSTVDVTRADAILIGHSHFDHLHGAQTISANTGARIVGSHETVRLMVQAGVPADRLVAVSVGDLVELAPGVRARVLPSVHSCTWASPTPDPAVDETDVPLHERQRRFAANSGRRYANAPAELVEHIAACGERSRGDGNAYGYLIDTPDGRIYWADTSGYWTGIVRDLRPDVAVLAAAGRGNVDGEPTSDRLAEFIATEVELMRPGQVVLCHHDDWMPPVTRAVDVEPVRAAVAARTPGIPVHSLAYGQALTIG